MERHTIITLRQQGRSLREISRITGSSRKAVTRYWNDYLEQSKKLDDGEDKRAIQERLTEGPRYDASERAPVKYTPAIDEAIDSILDGGSDKLKALGPTHEQHLTVRRIHALLIEQGFDIGLTTVSTHVGVKRKAAKEAFIRQQYGLGQRLEYDFGEVRLVIGGVVGTYHMAALASPAADFRWAYLYTNRRKGVFLDSHVRFFAMIGGVWGEVVYDNMRNVVTRFIGRNEKELDADPVKMSIYYGFTVNVTNCFAGNEKGYVESSVKLLRNRVFATRYAFDTLEEAKDHLAEELVRLDAASRIEEEEPYLIPVRPPLEIARISEHTVDKYSFIRVEGGFYSVPDHLVGHTLTVKVYAEETVVFAGLNEVCRHRRVTEDGSYPVDIYHYLDTLARKPGAVKNPVALRSIKRLKEVFDEHYADRPRGFIALLGRLKDHPIDDVADILSQTPSGLIASPTYPGSVLGANIQRITRDQLTATSAAFPRGGECVAG